MHSVKNLLIVGAGMCGMSLGVALKRARSTGESGNPTKLTEPGTGISLQGPALRAVQTVGVLDHCISRGFGYSYFKACDAMGNVTGTENLPRLLGPNYPATIGILRQSVHEVLADELSGLGVPIRLSTTVDTLTQDDQGVTVQFTNGKTARYDLVVGADGMNSLIRDIAFGPKHRPHYTGQIVWRATVSRPRDVESSLVFWAHQQIGLQSDLRWSNVYLRRAKCARAPHWNNASSRRSCAICLLSLAASSDVPAKKYVGRSRSHAGLSFQ